MASFLDPNDPRIQGPGAMAAADPAGDWFAAQGAPYQTQGSATPNYVQMGSGNAGGAGGGLDPWGRPVAPPQGAPYQPQGSATPNYVQMGSGDAGGAGGALDPWGRPVAPPGGQPATGGGGGGDTAWWDPQDPRGSIDRLFGGQPPSSQTILAHAPQLQAAGIQISPPNAEGVTSKINIPGVGWTRILEGGTAGGQGTGWNYVPQGVGGGSGGGMSSLGALAGGLDPSAAGRLGYSGGLNLGTAPLPGMELDTTIDPTTNPGYQFRMQQGAQALERGAAAKGTLLTGGTAKALERYGQDYASNEFQNAYNRKLGENQISYGRALDQNQIGYGRAFGENQAAYGRLFGEQVNRGNQLQGLAQIGMNAAGAQANLGQNYGNQAGTVLGNQAANIGNLTTGAGNANAASTLAQANAWQQGLQGVGNGVNQALQMYYLSKLGGGGGGGGGTPGYVNRDIANVAAAGR